MIQTKRSSATVNVAAVEVESEFTDLVDPNLEEAFSEMAAPAKAAAAVEYVEEALSQLLSAYLTINVTPSREQVQSLAASLGISTETLAPVVAGIIEDRVTALGEQAPSIITDPIDTDERMANDGMPDEHVVRLRRAELERHDSDFM